jgi:hypothetical protein
MGACARNMSSDSAEIKPAQCCIKLVFHLTYTIMHGSTKLKYTVRPSSNPPEKCWNSNLNFWHLFVLFQLIYPQYTRINFHITSIAALYDARSYILGEKNVIASVKTEFQTHSPPWNYIKCSALINNIRIFPECADRALLPNFSLHIPLLHDM